MKKKPLIDNSKLLDLLDSRKKPAGLRAAENRIPEFKAAADGKRATIHIYDAIAWWSGNDARTFQQKLSNLKVDTIELRINSPGGSVFEGVTIFNMLVAHAAKVEVHIDGLAGSIASLIALAGDEIHIAENAMFMIHNPSVIAWGESETLRKAAETLDQIKDAILNTYVSRTGGDRDELSRLMNEETWFTADEAISRKFADQKFAPVKAAACWCPEDFPDLPENIRVLFGKPEQEEEESGSGETKDKPENEPENQSEDEPVGTIEDVKNAAAFLASMRAAHDL